MCAAFLVLQTDGMCVGCDGDMVWVAIDAAISTPVEHFLKTLVIPATHPIPTSKSRLCIHWKLILRSDWTDCNYVKFHLKFCMGNNHVQLSSHWSSVRIGTFPLKIDFFRQSIEVAESQAYTFVRQLALGRSCECYSSVFAIYAYFCHTLRWYETIYRGLHALQMRRKITKIEQICATALLSVDQLYAHSSHTFYGYDHFLVSQIV